MSDIFDSLFENADNPVAKQMINGIYEGILEDAIVNFGKEDYTIDNTLIKGIVAVIFNKSNTGFRLLHKIVDVEGYDESVHDFLDDMEAMKKEFEESNVEDLKKDEV